MIELISFSEESVWLTALLQDFKSLLSDGSRANKQKFHVALAGGSTPKSFYSALNKEGLEKAGVEWWLGDERWVPPSDSSSNEKMIRETLGEGKPDFDRYFHSWHLALSPDEAAKRYESELQKHLGNPPIFDLILLGLGNDGHTASLFPNTLALDEMACDATANEVTSMKTTRLTFTYPILNRARNIWFLVQGKEKQSMIQRLIDRDASIPSARIASKKQSIYYSCPAV
jgi:6-phosphogluconolactonase